MNNNITIGIDPGSEGTGIAVFYNDEKLPRETKIFTSNMPKHEHKMIDIAEDVGAEIGYHAGKTGIQQTLVVIEYPQFFKSDTGQVAANSGSLVKLSMIAAMIYYAAYTNTGGNVKFVEVNAWKGELKKPIVIDRICRILDCTKTAYKSHVWDAIGIALHAQGRF